MLLLRRSSIKFHLSTSINTFIDHLLPFDQDMKWINQTEDEIRAAAGRWIMEETGYAIFSHRWLAMGELTFQDVLKIGEIPVEGFRELSEEIMKERCEWSGREMVEWLCARGGELSKAGSAPETREEENPAGLGLLSEIKTFCDGLSYPQRRHCQDLVKLIEFCTIASQCGCKFAWLDTGCIDKSRSAELEESIRSMFNWYRDAKICIVHLAETTTPRTFESDPWFTRGWTLQELLAPRRILFFGKTWGRITPNTNTNTNMNMEGNDKVPDEVLGIPLWETISQVTGIETRELLDFDAGIEHARDALGWVSKRSTTRLEDMAYCLIGLLQIPMSVAYGEGSMAFHRLQVEILQRSGDMGVFAWTGRGSSFNSMLASNAGCFRSLPLQPLVTEPQTESTFSWDQAQSTDQAYVLTNKGLRISLPVYGAYIRSQEVIKEGPNSGVVRTHLGLVDMDQEVIVVSGELGGYRHLGIAVLTGVADEERNLAILLGMKGDCCVRIPTREYIVLSPILRMKQPVTRFIN